MKNYTFQWDTWYPSLFAVCSFFSPNETNFIVSLFYNKYRFEESGAHVPNLPSTNRSTCLHSPAATTSFLIRSFRFTFPSRFAPFRIRPNTRCNLPRFEQSFNPIPTYAILAFVQFSFSKLPMKLQDIYPYPIRTRGIIYAFMISIYIYIHVHICIVRLTCETFLESVYRYACTH